MADSPKSLAPPPGAVLAIQEIGEAAVNRLAARFDTGVSVKVTLGDLDASGRFPCSIHFDFLVRGVEPPEEG